MASLLRVIDALLETEELELDPTRGFSSRAFNIAWREDRWFLEPLPPGPSASESFLLAATPVVKHNGKAASAPVPLADDDQIDTSLSVWLFRDGPEARNAELEAAALSGGDPEWRVLSDWLQERGDPLGEAIVRHFGSNARRCLADDPADIPAEFALGEYISGDATQRCEVELVHGLVKRLTVRSLRNLDATFLRVLRLRSARFLQEVVLDVQPTRISQWCERLETLPFPPSLVRVCFGSLFTRPPDFVQPRTPLSLRLRCPHLEENAEVRFVERASIELLALGALSSTPGLTVGHPVRVSGGSAIVAVEGAIALLPTRPPTDSPRFFEFVFDDGRWFLRASDLESGVWPDRTRLKASIAGVRVRNTPLLHGDLIDLGAGTLLRFSLS